MGRMQLGVYVIEQVNRCESCVDRRVNPMRLPWFFGVIRVWRETARDQRATARDRPYVGYEGKIQLFGDFPEDFGIEIRCADGCFEELGNSQKITSTNFHQITL